MDTTAITDTLQTVANSPAHTLAAIGIGIAALAAVILTVFYVQNGVE